MLPSLSYGSRPQTTGAVRVARARRTLDDQVWGDPAWSRDNWLVFGERQRAFDSVCAAELDALRADGFLTRLELVFSRDADGGEYVQDRLRALAGELRAAVAAGAVIYVCGSLQGMAGGVDAALAEILGAGALDDLASANRYRRDVY